MLNNLNSDVTKPNTSSQVNTDQIEERIEDVQQQVNDLKDEVNKKNITKDSVTATGVVTQSLTSSTIQSNKITTDEIKANTADIDTINKTHIKDATIDTLKVVNQIDEVHANKITGNTGTFKSIKTDELETDSFSVGELDVDNLESEFIHAKYEIRSPQFFGNEITTATVNTEQGNIKYITSEGVQAKAVQTEKTNTEEIVSTIADFINTTTKTLESNKITLTNTINLDPPLQTPEDWYTLTIPDYSIAQIFLHYTWMGEDNNISITKSGKTASIQYDISNLNAIKSISFTKEDGSIKVQFRADEELQYAITHLKEVNEEGEEIERSITASQGEDEYTDYIFTPTKLHTYLYKGFGISDYSMEFPGYANFSILHADEEVYDLLAAKILKIDDAIRLPKEWDEENNITDTSDGEEKQIIRIRKDKELQKPVYESPVDNEEVFPLTHNDLLVTQQTVANYDGTVEDEEEEEDGTTTITTVYPITNLGNNTITHGQHAVVGDLNVRGEVTAHTADFDKDVTIRGDLYVEGTTTTTNEAQVATSGDYIVTRENNPTGLGTNEKSGLVINNYKIEDGVSKAASITVDKDGVIGISANTTINNATYNNISVYNGKTYQGLTNTESTATLDIITSEEGDEKEDAVFYDGNYYYWTGEDWRGPIQYTDDKGLYGDVVEEPALESLEKHALTYYKTVTTQSINPEDVEALATREGDMDDKYYPIYNKAGEILQTSTSCIYSKEGITHIQKEFQVDTSTGTVKVSNTTNEVRVQSPSNCSRVVLQQDTHQTSWANTNGIMSVTKAEDGTTHCTCLLFPAGGQSGPGAYSGFANLVMSGNKIPGSTVPVITEVSASKLGLSNAATIDYKTFFTLLGKCGVPQGKVFLCGYSADYISQVTGLKVGTLSGNYNTHPRVEIEWSGQGTRFTDPTTACTWSVLSAKITNSNGKSELLQIHTDGTTTPVFTEREYTTSLSDCSNAVLEEPGTVNADRGLLLGGNSSITSCTYGRAYIAQTCPITYNPSTGTMCRCGSCMSGFEVCLNNAGGNTCYTLLKFSPASTPSCFSMYMHNAAFVGTLMVADNPKSLSVSQISALNSSTYSAFGVGNMNSTECIWITYNGWRPGKFISSIPVTIVCSQTTAPSGITFQYSKLLATTDQITATVTSTTASGNVMVSSGGVCRNTQTYLLSNASSVALATSNCSCYNAGTCGVFVGNGNMVTGTPKIGNTIIGALNTTYVTTAGCGIQCNTIIGYNNKSCVNTTGTLNQVITEVGTNNTVCNSFSTVMGYSNTVTGNYSVAIGANNTAISCSVSVGRAACANNCAVAIGNCVAACCCSVAIGIMSTACPYSTALGFTSKTCGNYSVAIGYCAAQCANGITINASNVSYTGSAGGIFMNAGVNGDLTRMYLSPYSLGIITKSGICSGTGIDGNIQVNCLSFSNYNSCMYFRTGRVFYLPGNGTPFYECYTVVPVSCCTNGSTCTTYWTSACLWQSAGDVAFRPTSSNPLSRLNGGQSYYMLTGACMYGMVRCAGANTWNRYNLISYPSYSSGVHGMDYDKGWSLGWNTNCCFEVNLSYDFVIPQCSSVFMYVSWVYIV